MVCSKCAFRQMFLSSLSAQDSGALGFCYKLWGATSVLGSGSRYDFLPTVRLFMSSYFWICWLSSLVVGYKKNVYGLLCSFLRLTMFIMTTAVGMVVNCASGTFSECMAHLSSVVEIVHLFF